MVDVRIETAAPPILAAARRTVRIGEVGQAFGPALDEVWAFLKRNPGLRTDGHNVFLYHHPANRFAPMEVDFGVEVTRRFPDEAGVRCIETPSGRAAVAVHRGPYALMKVTHDAIHAFCAANGHAIGAHSLEIYGDHDDDPSKLETEIVYLLATPSGAAVGP